MKNTCFCLLGALLLIRLDSFGVVSCFGDVSHSDVCRLPDIIELDFAFRCCPEQHK